MLYFLAKVYDVILKNVSYSQSHKFINKSTTSQNFILKLRKFIIRFVAKLFFKLKNYEKTTS